MMPGRLAKHGERQRMSLRNAMICVRSGANVRRHFRAEQSGGGRSGFKSPHPSQNLTAIVSGHTDRSDLRGAFIYIKIGRVLHSNTSVAEEHRPLGIVGKSGEEF